VRQKVIGAARQGADVVVVPVLNAPDARKAAAGRIRVIAVKTFRGALTALGEKPPAT
jgi:predicted S18 family serine protease